MNNNHEVEIINKNSSNTDLKFFCDICDFQSVNKDDLKSHNYENHEVKCDHCGETFEGRRKLEKHICRLNIQNPAYIDMYMKNWYVRNDCIRVFSKRLKKEIILLHSEHCWEKENFCSEMPGNFDQKEKSILDENNLLHVPAKKSETVRKDGSICWLALRGTMDKLTDYKIL